MTNPLPSSRILLVADPRGASAAASSAPVRRYRLARLSRADRSTDSASRMQYLKRSFD